MTVGDGNRTEDVVVPNKRDTVRPTEKNEKNLVVTTEEKEETTWVQLMSSPKSQRMVIFD